MSRPTSSSHLYDDQGRHGSPRSLHPRRGLAPPPFLPEDEVFSYSAEFHRVPPRIERFRGKSYWVDEVSTCQLDENRWDSTQTIKEYRDHLEPYEELVEDISKGIPCAHFRFPLWPEHGFWRVDDSLSPDDEGFVTIYGFKGLLFEVSVPNGRRNFVLDIGTKDVANVLTFIWEKVTSFYERDMASPEYNLLVPPYSGTLYCKGRFENAGIYREDELIPTRRGPPPRVQDDTRYDLTIRWRVRELVSTNGTRYDYSNARPRRTYAEGSRHPGRHGGRYSPDITVEDYSDRDGGRQRPLEESRMRVGRRRPELLEPPSRSHEIAYPRARSPAASGSTASSRQHHERPLPRRGPGRGHARDGESGGPPAGGEHWHPDAEGESTASEPWYPED